MLSLTFKNDTQVLMARVIFSLIPAIAYKLYLTSWSGLFAFITLLGTALLTEKLLAKAFKIHYDLTDCSAAITAILLFLSLNANQPWFVYFAASFIGIGLAKSIYGGFAKNIFNPAMVGWCFVMLSFPQYVTKYTDIARHSLDFSDSLAMFLNTFNVDAVSQATPLTQYKEHNQFYYKGLDFIQQNMLIAIGGLYLLARRVITLTMPVCLMLGSLVGFAIFGFSLDSDLYRFFMYSPLLLGAFYIITDPVSSPSTVKGQALYAFIIGFVSVLIGVLGAYPIGLAFAVLLGNGFMFIYDDIFIKEKKDD